MRWLTSHLKRRRSRERGVSSIALGIMAPVLIAGAGLGIDAGNLALEANRVQKAADSAALAVGQDCAQASRPDATTAQKNKCTPAAAQATAQAMANANSNGTTPVVANVSSTSTGLTVTITKDVSMPMGSAVGVGDKDVAATAKVAWNFIPVAARTFPLAMSVCDYYDWKASSNKTQKKLYRYDLYQSGGFLGLPSLFGDSCTDPATNKTISTAGGAMWLPSLGSLIGGECNVDTRLGNVLTGSIISTGLTIPADCLARARDIEVGEVYLVPIYQTTNVLGLNINISATIKGYAPFKITGYRIGSTLGSIFNPLDPAVKLDSSAPACSSGIIFNRCFGVQGYFTGAIGSLEGVTEWGAPVGGIDLGIVLAKLVS